MSEHSIFRCGITSDFLNEKKQLVYQDIGLGTLDAAGIRHDFLSQGKAIEAPQLDGLDAVISLTPVYNAESFIGISEKLLAVVRFGVGYDMIDVDACTDAGVALFITRGAVNHSVAEATLTWMLALSHNLVAKDRLVRDGRWAERGNHMGSELRGKRLGLVGAGGIGSALIELLKGFGMNRPLIFDPYINSEQAKSMGAEKVELNQLLQEADFVSINCPLTDETVNLIDHAEIAQMKPSAFLINTARGSIVNESALYNALKERRIAGAATDVFAEEPARENHPFCHLDNILLAPHCFAWTDELFAEIGHMAASAVVELSQGKVAEHLLVNTNVLKHPAFQKKLSRFQPTHTPVA